MSNQDQFNTVSQCLSPTTRLIESDGSVAPIDDLKGCAARAAGAFADKGLKPGDRIVIEGDASASSSLAYLGALYGGYVAVPVPTKSVASAIIETGAKAVWIKKPQPHMDAGDGAALIGLESLEGPRHMPAACDGSDLAALMATSGSTGSSKFVQVSHGNLIANTRAIIDSQALSPSDIALQILPNSYCFGISVLLSHLMAGGQVVFDRRFMFPDKVLDAIAEHSCTSFAGVPTAYSILANRSNLADKAIPSLKRLLQAGGKLADTTLSQIRAALPSVDFYVMYGQTEATARITTLPPEVLDKKLGSVGVPLNNVRLGLVPQRRTESMPVRDADVLTEAHALSKRGEIVVSGPAVTAGYWNATELTETRIQSGWLLTGDLGHIDSEGYLWIEGRTSEMVKMRGIRVSLGEVDQALSGVNGVDLLAAIQVPHAEAGEAIRIYAVLAPASDPSSTMVEIRKAAPTEWCIESIEFLDELPLTPTGKISRAALAERKRHDS